MSAPQPLFTIECARCGMRVPRPEGSTLCEPCQNIWVIYRRAVKHGFYTDTVHHREREASAK